MGNAKWKTLNRKLLMVCTHIMSSKQIIFCKNWDIHFARKNSNSNYIHRTVNKDHSKKDTS